LCACIGVSGELHGHAVVNGPRIDVFAHGEAGFLCIRLPSLIIGRRPGVVLAIAEAARWGPCADDVWTDIVIKRSYDSGATWDALRIIYGNSTSPDKLTIIGNQAPVLDKLKGRHLMPFGRNNAEYWLTYSDDDGDTWSVPTPILNVVDPSWSGIGTGYSGIQLKSGRIFIPAYHYPTPDTGAISHSLYSDDHGHTWQVGGNWTLAPHSPSEAQAIQLVDGGVLFNARGALTQRPAAVSYDEGITFGTPFLLSRLQQPMRGCQGSTIAHPTGMIFYSGLDEADSTGLRFNISLFVSEDQAKTWKLVNVIDPGPSAYSSLAMLPSGSVALLYERAKITPFDPDFISFQVVWQM